MKFNLGTPANKYDQRNNKYKKTITGSLGESKMEASCMCNVTTLAEAFEIGEWRFPDGQYTQPEDNLCDHIVEKNLKEGSYYATHFPAMWKEWVNGKKDAYWPNEVHAVLADGVNSWMGCSKADKFVENCPINDILKQLYENRMPVPISVKFGKLNHIVLLTGFETDLTEADFISKLTSGSPIKITNFIYDDPYGTFDWKTLKYPTTRGNGDDQYLPYDKFIECVKPLGSKTVKYAHILSRPAATV